MNALCFDSKEKQEQDLVYRTPSYYNPRLTFHLPAGAGRHYQQQYDDMYFLRLAKLKPIVEQVAVDAWDGLIVSALAPRRYLLLSAMDVSDSCLQIQIAGEKVRRVDRVLDVRQGELCWVAGTVYMHLPMKPNILEDLSKEVSSLGLLLLLLLTIHRISPLRPLLAAPTPTLPTPL